MSDLYNSEVSKHYAAYRPPIHSKILHKVLADCPKFNAGLDIGCGTGVSTLALSHYCQTTTGIDPSQAMLDQADGQENVAFMCGSGENLPFADNSIDIVTFAGSLFYAKSDALVNELTRVCRSNALLVVYDFEVQLSELMHSLGVMMASSSSHYNHAENFSGCNAFKETRVYQGRLTLELTSEQLAHVLFSSQRRYLAFAEHFSTANLFSKVVEMLNQTGLTHPLSINSYYSTYQVLSK